MRRLIPPLAVVASTCALIAGCSSGSSQSAKPDAHKNAEEAAPAAHWSYKGAEGPDNWGSINKEFATCKEGRAQSPIDLGQATLMDAGKDITIDYKPSIVELVNNGHTVQANVSAGNGITIDGTRYALQQFHFHLPSEHTINGKSAAMELHFVNKTAQGHVAVLSALMDAKSENSVFGPLWQSLPSKQGATVKVHKTIELNSLLPADRARFQYAGSLTTPPCTEDVKWIVFKDPVAVTADQVAQYRTLYSGTNRPRQPLNGRTVTESGK